MFLSMEWTGQGIVLSSKDYGNGQVILSIFTEQHGRCQGLVYGGRSQSNRAAIQTGNFVHATWKSRLEDQLGYFSLELFKDNSIYLIQNPWSSYIITAATEIVYRLFPDRQTHPKTYHAFCALLRDLNNGFCQIISHYIQWEIVLLSDIGFGLDLSGCAVTGQKDDLKYVSPKSGRAVGGKASTGWQERLLPLPDFLTSVTSEGKTQSLKELLQGLDLTGFFLEKYALSQSISIPKLQARERLITMIRSRHKATTAVDFVGTGLH